MKNQVVPPSFLFQYQMTVPFDSTLPQRKGRLLQLEHSAPVFTPCLLNGDAGHLSLWIAWNSDGLGIQIDVHGKKLTPAGRRRELKTSDFAAIYIDTRHTANVHRATEFCSSVVVLPADDDADDRPSIQFAEIAQQRTAVRDRDGRKCSVQCTPHSDGYVLEIWIPGTQLPGFPEAPEIGRIGFYCVVHDTELGELPLSIGDDFPIAFDPSTWIQLELKK